MKFPRKIREKELMLKLMRAPSRYVQGKDALLEAYEHTKELGKSFLFVCSRSGSNAARPKIEKSFDGQASTILFEVFGGISSIGEIERIRQIVRDKNIDVVVAVGGGNAIDTAKATAYYEKLPIVIMPTIASTDAPCTGLSVIYKDDGSFSNYIFYPTNPNVVIVDTALIAKAPVRFLVAGMGDALGTYFEARACVKTNSRNLVNGGITRSAMALCKLCYETLIADGYQAKLAVERGALTPAVENIIEANTYLSGVGADNGGLAVAHAMHNGFTALEECRDSMHGELVAMGTIVQLVIENAPKAEVSEVIEFCVSVGLPVTLAQIGIKNFSRLRMATEKACQPGETIHNMLGDVAPDELYDALIAADALGKTYCA
jgi:glycerol dehydrogenase